MNDKGALTRTEALKHQPHILAAAARSKNRAATHTVRQVSGAGRVAACNASAEEGSRYDGPPNNAARQRTADDLNLRKLRHHETNPTTGRARYDDKI